MTRTVVNPPRFARRAIVRYGTAVVLAAGIATLASYVLRTLHL